MQDASAAADPGVMATLSAGTGEDECHWRDGALADGLLNTTASASMSAMLSGHGSEYAVHLNQQLLQEAREMKVGDGCGFGECAGVVCVCVVYGGGIRQWSCQWCQGTDAMVHFGILPLASGPTGSALLRQCG